MYRKGLGPSILSGLDKTPMSHVQIKQRLACLIFIFHTCFKAMLNVGHSENV